jgi:thioredoxin 1
MLFITREEELQIDSPMQALYFYATWMPYHSKFITMISKIEDKYKDISFSAVDVEQFSNQCKRFSINSIPTVLILKEGKEIKRINGLVLTSAFKSAFADICIS